MVTRLTKPPSSSTDPLVYGLDAKHGGTWFGYNRELGLAVGVTNVRTKLSQSHENMGSRGTLVLDVLREVSLQKSIWEAGASGVPLPLKTCYPPFNLFIARFGNATEPMRAYHLSNVEKCSEDVGGSSWVGGLDGSNVNVCSLGFGVHVVSNGPGVNDKTWPKVFWLSETLERVLLRAQCDGGYVSLTSCTAPFLNRETFPDGDPTRNLAWSSRSPLEEASLQRRVVIPVGDPIKDYGSRTLSVVMSPVQGRAAVFAWHELQGECEESGKEDSLGEIEILRGVEPWRVIFY